MTKVRIWDLPTRLFHWSLAVLVFAAIITVKVGGNAMVWHFYCGYTILALLIFRLIWGIIGARYARFSSFSLRPASLLAYLREPKAGHSQRFAGHTPIGSLSVLAILLVLLAQACSGLFANDDIDSEGPLVKFISKDVSDQFSWFHAELNSVIIYGLIALHIAAIAYYFFRKKENLVKPMLTGDKENLDISLAAKDTWRSSLLALILFALSFASVVWLTKR